ncbi:MAG TPA: transglycosylase SLT domain-containing protein [Verrucomicrobiae bacterium]|nr:transglycosylase SLT domain-containing protein [Verrucomicrobiae bacterium]
MALGVLFLASCQTKDSKKAAAPAAPPPQAVAPTVHKTVHKAVVAPPPVKVAPKAAPPKADPVAATIAAAEKAFQTGQDDFKAGHLDSAKQDFNRAVDILMQGPVAVKSDDRLQQEFDKITGEINKLEMVAFKKGDGFSEQPSEPAPIDEANMTTFPPDPNIKAKAEAELETTPHDLPLVINDYVAGYINYFSTRGRGTFENAWIRSGRYKDMIQRILREEGVPQDLIYLAQAESGFHPLALSRARARGMWQFMPSRAAGYDLAHNWWADDRQDPEKSTRAAARFLKALHEQFGDWYLAMAAYNSGPGNVQRAVRRTGYADFWELYRRDVLPRETKNYVPIILAMTIMSKNPAQYGLDAVKPDAAQKYDVVMVDYPVDLRLVSECVDVPVGQLEELNPSLLRGTTPRGITFGLRLPEGTKDKYASAIAAIPKDKRVFWRYHRVEAGETLASIAKKYHTTEHAISQANNLAATGLNPDSRVVIPGGGRDALKIAYSKHATRYKVHSGDSVLSVAEDFGVPPEKIRGWNRLKGNQLRSGKVLLIYKPVDSPDPARASAKRHKKKHSTKAKPTSKPQQTKAGAPAGSALSASSR